MGFKSRWGGDYVECFENPSKKEVSDIGNNVRWILDAKNKKAYAFNGLDCLHGDAWRQIAKEIGDSRSMYHTPELLPVETYANKTEITTLFKDAYDPKVDWSWAKKYLPNIEKAMKDFDDHVKGEK